MAEQVLVVQAGGRRIALPLGDVVGIAAARLTPIPLTVPAHLGIMIHQGTAWPVFDPLMILGLGQLPTPADLAVLLEVEGHELGLACRRVEGASALEGRLGVSAGAGHEEVRVGGWPAVLPDLARALAVVLAAGRPVQAPA